MKKTIFSMALASILCFGTSSAFAQSATDTQETAKKECCKKDGKKCDKKDGKKCDKKDGKCCKQEGKKCQSPFASLNLTESQQTALAAIPTPRQVLKAAAEQNKEAKADQKQSREERMATVRNIYTDYLAKVKAVLTPEQYVQFLENSYIRSSIAKNDGAKKGDRKGGKKDIKKGDRKGTKGGMKGDRKGGKGQRPDKQQ